jgi:hypothetical protein
MDILLYRLILHRNIFTCRCCLQDLLRCYLEKTFRSCSVFAYQCTQRHHNSREIRLAWHGVDERFFLKQQTPGRAARPLNHHTHTSAGDKSQCDTTIRTEVRSVVGSAATCGRYQRQLCHFA